MKSVVVDASVAVCWFVHEAETPSANQLIRDGVSLIAPALILPEFANAVWKKWRRGQMDATQSEIAVRENGYETLHDGKGRRVLQDDYELTVIQKYEKGCTQSCVEHPWLERKIIFGRTDLKPHRQYIYDEDGKVVTDAKYAEYKDYDGISYPSRIEIFRPQEEYAITLNMLKVDINKLLTDDQFLLEQPPGADVIHLDRPQSSLAVPAGLNRP